MKKFEYTTRDHYEFLPSQWVVQSQHEGGWELVTIVPFKSDNRSFFRVYYKREVIE